MRALFYIFCFTMMMLGGLYIYQKMAPYVNCVPQCVETYEVGK